MAGPVILRCRLLQLQDLHSLLNGCWTGHFVLAACGFNRYLADQDARIPRQQSNKRKPEYQAPADHLQLCLRPLMRRQRRPSRSARGNGPLFTCSFCAPVTAAAFKNGRPSPLVPATLRGPAVGQGAKPRRALLRQDCTVEPALVALEAPFGARNQSS